MSDKISVSLVDLETLNGDPKDIKKLDQNIEITVITLPPAMINIVFDRMKVSNYWLLPSLINDSMDEIEEIDGLIAAEDDDQVKKTMIEQKVKKELECIRMKRRIHDLEVELGGVPDVVQIKTPTVSYLSRIADQICCDDAVVELATGRSICEFEAISSFTEWRAICNRVKELNTDFLSIFSERIGRK